ERASGPGRGGFVSTSRPAIRRKQRPSPQEVVAQEGSRTLWLRVPEQKLRLKFVGSFRWLAFAKPDLARLQVLGHPLNGDPPSAQTLCHNTRCVRPSEGIHYQI